jgi:hypothetical protein
MYQCSKKRFIWCKTNYDCSKKCSPTKHANLAGDLAGYLADDIVAKNCAIVTKTDLARDIVGASPEQTKLCYRIEIDITIDFTGDIAATKFCYCSNTKD